jgi:hypothetical protein
MTSGHWIVRDDRPARPATVKPSIFERVMFVQLGSGRDGDVFAVTDPAALFPGFTGRLPDLVVKVERGWRLLREADLYERCEELTEVGWGILPR